MEPKIQRQLACIKKGVIEQGKTLGPVVSVEQIACFERKLGVALPDDYRAFLMEVGNGGDGPPAYGLLALGDVPSDLSDSAEDVIARASLPFPLRKAWIWEESLPDEKEVTSIRQGILHLGTDGCGAFWVLVIGGAARGRVWQLADVGAQPCKPARTFLKWYQDWLQGREDWWEDAYSVPSKPRYDTSENRRLALALAQGIVGRSPARALEIAQRVEDEPGLRARAQLVIARAMLKSDEARAGEIAGRLVDEWTGPPVLQSANQMIDREELLELIESLTHDLPLKTSLKERLLRAPQPEVVVPVGDYF